jgi:hypothetical protein
MNKQMTIKIRNREDFKEKNEKISNGEDETDNKCRNHQ